MAGLTVYEDGLQSNAQGAEDGNVSDARLTNRRRREIPGDKKRVHQPGMRTNDNDLALGLLAIINLNVVEANREEEKAS